MPAAVMAPVSAQVVDLMVRRMERALRERVRYRYVQPQVLRENDSYRIQSPCCSRKVDPTGGLIDIALLVPHDHGHWCLCSRDHANNTWEPRHQMRRWTYAGPAVASIVNASSGPKTPGTTARHTP